MKFFLSICKKSVEVLLFWFIQSPLVFCDSAPPFYVLCCKTCCYSLQYWGQDVFVSCFYSLTGELASDQNHSTTSCCPFFQPIRFIWYMTQSILSDVTLKTVLCIKKWVYIQILFLFAKSTKVSTQQEAAVLMEMGSFQEQNTGSIVFFSLWDRGFSGCFWQPGFKWMKI